MNVAPFAPRRSGWRGRFVEVRLASYAVFAPENGNTRASGQDGSGWTRDWRRRRLPNFRGADTVRMTLFPRLAPRYLLKTLVAAFDPKQTLGGRQLAPSESEKNTCF